MNTILTVLLTLLGNIASTVASDKIQKIIDALVTLVPVLVKEYGDLKPMVVNIIDALKGNGEITPDQLDQLQALGDRLDADFDTAAAAATAEDAAAAKE